MKHNTKFFGLYLLARYTKMTTHFGDTYCKCKKISMDIFKKGLFAQPMQNFKNQFLVFCSNFAVGNGEQK